MEIAKIQLVIDFEDMYKNILEDDKTYSSPEYKEAYTNYRNSRKEMIQAKNNGFAGIGKVLEKELRQTLNDVLRKELKGIATVMD